MSDNINIVNNSLLYFIPVHCRLTKGFWWRPLVKILSNFGLNFVSIIIICKLSPYEDKVDFTCMYIKTK